ncbi:hypothetical protein [Marinimicrobium sp. ABcell2]|uniref:hypothetical protein n=1 Tax=Marinimicrobium sp. ABcell2 TaxID=3069751 RepID=UPI0027B46942|nr:hypothetical protein [Marinimicrobium sp. ABcell2]MDQ2077822.1 hypothetical protein [Marinimicrobium sp. ABcell2]
MIKLLDINDLKKEDIYQIWEAVSRGPSNRFVGNVAWSFEGNGIRTRTTFLQAFQRLGLPYVELPNFLKTGESVEDLAGYMDSFYSLYVIREDNHDRLAEFAAASSRPVINAMSSEAHPCEVLTDSFHLYSKYESLQKLRILLWGPPTNVFKSWHSLSRVLGLNVTQYCPAHYHNSEEGVVYSDRLEGRFDIVITDAWPTHFSDKCYSLSQEILENLGDPELLPTPPVTVGKELLFAPIKYGNFSGYSQKALLLPVQESIIAHVIEEDSSQREK